MMDYSVLAATGHRPHKLKDTSKLVSFAQGYMSGKKEYIKSVISGMALGWDLAWAEAAISLSIPVHAAVPFEGHHLPWSNEEQKHYRKILDQCTRVTFVSASWWPRAYQVRNEWMIHHCTGLVALWNGTNGGTANCIRYGRSRNVPHVNLWKEWING